MIAGDTADSLTYFAAPGTHQTRQAEDFALAHVEAHIVEYAGAGQMLHFQHHLADVRLQLGIQILDLPTHHGLHQNLIGDFLDIPGADVAGVPEHRDPIGQPVHILQPVGDEEDGFPLIPELLSDSVELLAFPLGKGRRGLVHNYDFRIGGNRLGYLYDLLLGNAQAAHFRLGVDVGTQAAQKLRRRLVHVLPVDEAQLVALHVTDEDVLRHGQLGIGGAVLIDGGDPAGSGIAGAAEEDLLSLDEYPALVRHVHTGDDLDQRGFSGAVFPHQCVNLAFSQLKLHIVQGRNTGESLGDVFQFQDNVVHRRTPFLFVPKLQDPGGIGQHHPRILVAFAVEFDGSVAVKTRCL